jgi:diguanylate cyclase (GGDEF)-like protein
LLSQIAYVIVAAGRDTDLVFRYGGDEFAILLPTTDVEGAMMVAQRINTAILGVGTPAGRGNGVQITASVGVATFPGDAATAEDMLLAADRACFVAKRTGGNRIATAAEGVSLAAEFSLQPPTPVDPPSRPTA